MLVAILAAATIRLVGLAQRAEAREQAGSPTVAVSVGDFGAVGDGRTDDHAAFQRALDQAAANGRVLRVPAGTYALHGTSPPRRGLVLPAGTRIEGDGAAKSQIVVTGAGTFDSVLWIRNASDVSIRGIGLRGNGRAYPEGKAPSDNNFGRAVTVRLDHAGWRGEGFPSPTGDLTGVRIVGNAFEHFNASGWLEVRNANDAPGASPAGDVRDVTIEDNVFTSRPGDALYPTAVGHVSAGVWLGGASYTTPKSAGLVRDVEIRGNTFNVGYIQNGVVVFSGARDIRIEGNRILEAGGLASGAGDITIAQYGVMVYDSAPASGYTAPAPADVTIANNQILGAERSGIYAAGPVTGLVIAGNTILGGSPVTDRIPTGGVALNDVTSAVVRDNRIHPRSAGTSPALFGVNVTLTRNENGSVRIEGNEIDQIPANGTAISIEQTAGPGTRAELRRNAVTAISSEAYSVVNGYRSGRFVVKDLKQTGFVRRLAVYREVGQDARGAVIWKPYRRFDEAAGLDIGGPGNEAILYRMRASDPWSQQTGFNP